MLHFNVVVLVKHPFDLFHRITLAMHDANPLYLRYNTSQQYRHLLLTHCDAKAWCTNCRIDVTAITIQVSDRRPRYQTKDTLWYEEN